MNLMIMAMTITTAMDTASMQTTTIMMTMKTRTMGTKLISPAALVLHRTHEAAGAGRKPAAMRRFRKAAEKRAQSGILQLL